MLLLEPFTFNRLDWGFENPNKTAALIALVLLALLSVPLWFPRARGACYVMVVPMFASLILTQSRSGIVSLAAGFCCLYGRGLWTRMDRRRTLTCLAIFVAVAGFASWAGAMSRYTKNVFVDPSIGNRFTIFRQLPHMLRDAGEGWGIGNAGDAFMQWYQPIGRIEMYQSLVSSHLTWLVEFNWIARGLYLFFWLLVFFFILQTRATIWRHVSLALWSSLFLSACFSTVGDEWIVWLLPCGALVGLVRAEYLTERRFPFRLAGLALGLASMLLGLASFVARVDGPRITVRRELGGALIGDGPATTLVYAPDRQVLGAHFGHEVRAYLSGPRGARGSVRITDTVSPEQIGDTHMLVVSGLSSTRFQALVKDAKACRLILMASPPESPNAYLESLDANTVLVVLVGDFVDFRFRREWEVAALSRRNVRTFVVKGADRFLPGWSRYLKNPAEFLIPALKSI